MLACWKIVWNAHLDGPFQPFSTPRPEEHFHRYFLAGFHIRIGNPRALNHCNSPFRQQVNGNVHSLQIRHFDRIGEDPVKLVSPPTSQHYSRRHGCFRWCLHVGKRQLLSPGHFHIAGQSPSGFVGEFIHPAHRIKQSDHHQGRGPFLMHEDIEMQLFFLNRQAGCRIRSQFNIHWNHRRFFTQNSHNAVMPILPKRAHNFSRVTEFVGLKLAGKDHQHFAPAHRHPHRAKV